VRIVAGEARGRKLTVPAGDRVRPTPQRVREALMSALQMRLPGAVVLDLFAGTGALALEALSRGARRAILVERDPSVARVVARNIAACGLEDRALLMRGDALTLLRRIEALGERFDIAFLDPPYESPLGTGALRLIARSSLLAEGATVVLEHAPGQPPGEGPEGLDLRRTVRYGDTCLSYLVAPPA
jgi:16S rRNA (guanine(966)-N(2))-methyltransferase RsmD